MDSGENEARQFLIPPLWGFGGLCAQDLGENNIIYVDKSNIKYRPCRGCFIPVLISDAASNGRPGFCSFLCWDKLKNKQPGFHEGRAKRRKEKRLKRAAKKASKRDRQKVRVSRKVLGDFYESREWRELRYKMLREWKWKCMSCGRHPPEVKIHVDHIRPRSLYPELELSFNNLQILCADCNIGKSNHYSDDLRSQGEKRNGK